ncbi:hypothetical protein [Pseudomonas sichuanensis]|uniref:hypothetical protein n=1 Tax=Pseudomonas TaxID=286 RepID=UPI0036EB605C
MNNIKAGGFFKVQGTFTAPDYSQEIDTQFKMLIPSPYSLTAARAEGFGEHDFELLLVNEEGFESGISYPVGAQDDAAYSFVVFHFRWQSFVGRAYSGEITIEEISDTLMKGSLELSFKQAVEGIDCKLTGTFDVTS